MADWTLSYADKYERAHKKYQKKRPNELIAVLNNLDTYHNALTQLNNPLLIKSGFIHPEPIGIIAIDQKGGKKKVKLKQTRLYIYPNVKTKTLHLLTIGDKTSQKSDIKYCKDIVTQIKEESS